MKTKKASRPKINKPPREPFATIDEAIDLNQKVHSVLTSLAQFKHPLDVRKAGQVGREVVKMAKRAQRQESIMIKDGSRTYFIDIEKMSDGKSYLKITESRYRGEGKDRERKDIIVFPEKAEEFAHAVAQMAGKLKEK